MKNVLVQMLQIFKPKGIDWMGYKLTQKNPYTYHHIKERRNGGPETITNGAILTRKAHDDLNELDMYCQEGYEAFQNLFRYINSLQRELTEEEELDLIDYAQSLAMDIWVNNIYPFRMYPRSFSHHVNKKSNKKKIKNK